MCIRDRLVACVLPVAAQYPVIPDSVKARGAKQEAEFERKSDAAWEKALPTVLEEDVYKRQVEMCAVWQKRISFSR